MRRRNRIEDALCVIRWGWRERAWRNEENSVYYYSTSERGIVARLYHIARLALRGKTYCIKTDSEKFALIVFAIHTHSKPNFPMYRSFSFVSRKLRMCVC